MAVDNHSVNVTEDLAPPLPLSSETLAQIIRDLHRAGHSSVTVIFQPHFQLIIGDQCGFVECDCTRLIKQGCVGSSHVGEPSEHPQVLEPRFPDLSALTLAQHRELCELLRAGLRGQTRPPEYAVAEDISVEELKNAILTNHQILTRGKRSQADRFRAIYRIGVISRFLQCHSEFVTNEELCRSLSITSKGLRRLRKHGMRVYEFFQVVGEDAFDQLQYLSLECFKGAGNYRDVPDFVKGVIDGVYHLP